eukprot:scaffold801_cov178-Ochromonas_danica.AAC.19
MRIFNIDAYPDLVIKADYLPPPPPLVIGLMGELRLLNIHAVEIAISHQNCLFLNAEKLPILSKGGSSNNSILPFVQKAIQEQGNPNLQAVIFWGLPRSEQEAHEYKDILLNEFDVLIELANQSEEAEEEEDELLQQHLDAIEVLRESFFSTDNNNANNNHSTNNNVENGTGGSDGKSISSLNCKAQWKKVIYEKDNYQSNRPEDLQKLITTLHQSLEDRRVRADAIAAINNEKPPRANDNPAKEIIESFILLRPRRQPEGIEIIKRPDHGDLDVLQADSPLFCLTKFQLAKRKDIVAKRVIIAGGSSHSYAFLETLCGVSDVYYPNIYFIAPIPPLPLKENDLGLPENTIEEIKHDNGEDYYYYSGCLSLQDVDFPHANELWAMGYRHCIHVIRGHLTDIDRENRAVVISDELVLEYDYLLISTNTQDNSSRRIPSIATTHPAKLADAGIFALGNTAADLLALTFVKKRINNRSEPIVISGQGVKVLAAAEGLIRAGIESNKIVCLIEESHHHLEGCGEDSYKVLNYMKYNQQSPQFSRVYRDDLPHHRFNPREVGVYVAWQMIIKHLHPQPDRLRNIKKSMTQLPTQDLRSNSSDTHSYTTPKTTSSSTTNSIKKQFMLPKSYYAALPGDLIYFYSSVPRLPRDLVGYLTDTASQPVQFFPHPPPPPRRITLLKTDAFGGVAELSYAGLDKVESRNLSLLVGKHEAYLNSAINAYNKKFVDDWISYFRGSWTTVLFQDTFSQLISALKKNMQSDKGMIMLLSRIFEKADLESDNVAVSEYRTNLMGAHGELAPEITRKIVEVETLEYLRENKDFLPKLYLPGAH